jgi:hypothetical protein
MTAFRTYLISFMIMIMASLGLGVMPAVASENPEKNIFEPYVAVNDYWWKETIDGLQLMKETGTLYAAGFMYTHIFDNQMTLKPAIEVFGGDVDYDGATQAGVPVKSTTKYFGFKLWGDVGYQFSVGRSSSVEPFAGLAVWTWSRTVQDATAADGTPAFGYTEDWTTFFARLGVRGEAALSGSVRWFAEGGMKLPIYNENYAHIDNGITLEPGRQVAFFAETGIAIHSFKASVTYDQQRYSQSNSSQGWIQPESKSDQYGLKIGWAF